MKAKDWINISLKIMAIIVGGGIAFNVHNQNKELQEVKEYWEDPNFKTDSVIVDVDYSKLPTPKFKYEVPPAKIYRYYQKDTVVLNNTTVSMDSSLLEVIDSLEGVITQISLDYIKLYPTASKLIYAEFTKDTIHLDLLDIQGNIQKNVYPVNYSRFGYQYRENQFRASSLPSRSNLFKESYVYLNGGFSLTHMAPILGVDAGTNLGKNFIAGGYSLLTLQQSPTLNAGVVIKYNVLGWREGRN